MYSLKVYLEKPSGKQKSFSLYMALNPTPLLFFGPFKKLFPKPDFIPTKVPHSEWTFVIFQNFT